MLTSFFIIFIWREAISEEIRRIYERGFEVTHIPRYISLEIRRIYERGFEVTLLTLKRIGNPVSIFFWCNPYNLFKSFCKKAGDAGGKERNFFQKVFSFHLKTPISYISIPPSTLIT